MPDNERPDPARSEWVDTWQQREQEQLARKKQ